MLLRGLIQREEWDEIRARLQSDCAYLTLELSSRDRLNRTTLHNAAAKLSAPSDLVILLADRAPRRILQAVDVGGNTVLHMAAATGNAAVLRALLEKMARLQQQQGQQQSISSTNNDNGLTPAALAWKKYLHPDFTLFDRSDSTRRDHLPVTELQTQHLQALCRTKHFGALNDRNSLALLNLWNKTVVLCYAATHPGMEYPIFGGGLQWNSLRALVQYGGDHLLQWPSIAVQLALQLQCHDCDTLHKELARPVDAASGNLLLHVAASSSPCPIVTLSTAVHRQLEQQMDPTWSTLTTRSVVACVCHWYPAAAAVRNTAGQLPIHAAIATAKPWKGGVDVLLQAFPAAADEIDRATGLAPALQAAASPKCRLTVVWELLRNRPDQLSQWRLKGNSNSSSLGRGKTLLPAGKRRQSSAAPEEAASSLFSPQRAASRRKVTM